MKKYQYSVSTSTIWASFDFGEVEAQNIEEARAKAIEQLRCDFQKANDVFAHCDVTQGFFVEFNEDEVTVALAPCRKSYIDEIKSFVDEQGTLVQEDGFPQEPVHHLVRPIWIKGFELMYVGTEAAFTSKGLALPFDEMHESDLGLIHGFLNY